MRATTTSVNDLFRVHSETLWNFIMGLMEWNNYVLHVESGRVRRRSAVQCTQKITA